MALEDARFAIVANGFADGPAQALRTFLVARGATVIAVSHPLVPEAGWRHEISTYAGGEMLGKRSLSMPVGPPLSFALDPFIPMRVPTVDAWFGFNCVACARGIIGGRFGRVGKVVLWSVDFVPDRFGKGPLTKIYDTLDRYCCMQADARIELSEAARDGRDARHRLDPTSAAPTHIVPMGAWTDRVPTVPEDGFAARRVAFLGHLVTRQGVAMLLEAIAVLVGRRVPVHAVVIGGGPLERELRERASSLGLQDVVSFHGFVEDHADVERLLAQSSVAVALYEPSANTFTRFADPGKLKAYLAAGLPILLTAVPPNAQELASQAGAEIVRYDANAVADAIEASLDSPTSWSRRRAEALSYARRYDWNVLLGDVLTALGFAID